MYITVVGQRSQNLLLVSRWVWDFWPFLVLFWPCFSPPEYKWINKINWTNRKFIQLLVQKDFFLSFLIRVPILILLNQFVTLQCVNASLYNFFSLHIIFFFFAFHEFSMTSINNSVFICRPILWSTCDLFTFICINNYATMILGDQRCWPDCRSKCTPSHQRAYSSCSGIWTW